MLPLVVSHFPVGLSFSKELELFPGERNLQININLNNNWPEYSGKNNILRKYIRE